MTATLQHIVRHVPHHTNTMMCLVHLADDAALQGTGKKKAKAEAAGR
jgi:hypothetical protein